MLNQWPAYPLPPLPTIHQMSVESLLNMSPVGLSTLISGTLNLTNRAQFSPFRLQAPITVKRLFCANGTAVNGNIDLGIYAYDGTRIISTGSTAQAGTSVVQSITIADTLIGPGDFWFAFVMDNATGTVVRLNMSSTPGAKRAGIMEKTSAFPLPATVTMAANTASLTALMGLRWGGTAI